MDKETSGEKAALAYYEMMTEGRKRRIAPADEELEVDSDEEIE
jgi:hypothetical protein